MAIIAINCKQGTPSLENSCIMVSLEIAAVMHLPKSIKQFQELPQVPTRTKKGTRTTKKGHQVSKDANK